MEYIELIILYVLSILMIIKPKLLWKIENIFTVKNGEPTDFYIAFCKLSAYFCLSELSSVRFVCCCRKQLGEWSNVILQDVSVTAFA